MSHLLSLAVATLAALPQAAPAPQLHLLRDVRLVDSPDAPRVQIVLAHGRIQEVLEAEAPAPPGARVVEGKGALVLPAFIDAYTHTGVETPAPVATQDKPVDTSSDVRVDMRQANRKGLQPAFQAAAALDLTEKAKGHRESGFGALLSAPNGQILAGKSVLATTRDTAAREAVIAADVFAHAAFRASGGGYPSTLMGFTAQLRQFFLDVHRHGELTARYAEGRPGPRPPFDAELEAGQPILRGELRVVCEAEGARDIERWVRLARELGLDIAISGGREAYRHAQLLADREIPVFMTLSWGDEPDDPHKDEKEKEKEEAVPEDPTAATITASAPVPADEPDVRFGEEDEADDDAAESDEDEGEGEDEDEDEGEDTEDEARWQYEQPLGVREERRRLWEERRDGAAALYAAEVPFAFGSGSDSPADLLKRVRTLVENGLSSDVALAGLTSSAADLLGVGQRMGRVAPGFDATIALWTEHPLTTKDAQLAWLFVEGFPHEFEVKPEKDKGAGTGEGPAEGLDVTGTWKLEIESEQGDRTMTAVLAMEPDGAVSGTLTSTNPMDDSEMEMECEGRLDGKQLVLEAEMSFGEFSMDMEIRGEVDGDEFDGALVMKSPRGERSLDAKGLRQPGRDRQAKEVR